MNTHMFVLRKRTKMGRWIGCGYVPGANLEDAAQAFTERRIAPHHHNETLVPGKIYMLGPEKDQPYGDIILFELTPPPPQKLGYKVLVS